MTIQVDRASRSFGPADQPVVAACDVSFDVRGGELVVLQGSSGSGKTTLLNMIAGLERADSGRVLLDGVDVQALTEPQRADLRLRRVGVVFQDNNLIDELTAAENVALPLLALRWSPARAAGAAEEAMRRVGIEHLLDRFPAQMSGGQRQRVGVARGLVGERDVLLADEPTGALDRATSRSLFDLVRRLAVEAGAAVLVATHDPLAREYATRVLTVVDGQVSEG